MKKLLNDVARFQKAYEAPCHANLNSATCDERLTTDRQRMRLRLVFEEVLELATGHGMSAENIAHLHELFEGALHDTNLDYRHDIYEVADAIGDSIYVLVGMALEYGLPLDHIWEEIQRSNMKKFPDGRATFREDGKLQKPEGWKPPDIVTAANFTSDASWQTMGKIRHKAVRQDLLRGLVHAPQPPHDLLKEAFEYIDELEAKVVVDSVDE